ncbi:ParB/RepB/Spo0J family partition protein [Methylomonas koyamae]|uniref:Uncharacterized protein n=1 Tax=Methylomonas koyamae TaxID=702114 RepID=A0A291IQD4_9GAMM|nr:ParB/RepB/Spo0J family partition protein [Methylomonas koyamae]ATG92463.1 hypothetical protein MKLM6_4299 [Methylomonas koyamae]OAI25569.1 hypothetical protein A1356_01000 [Methylomonas koyamae]
MSSNKSSRVQALGELNQRIKKGRPAPSKHPSRLPLNKIELIEEVFQPRKGGALGTIDGQKHVKALELALKHNQGNPLEPILIYWVGDAWACIDGHHRYEAYKANGWRHNVPVKVFEGSVIDAFAAARGNNVKDKRPMSPHDKSQFAWELVNLTKETGERVYSKAEIARMSNRSPSLVGNMIHVSAELRKRYAAAPLERWTHALKCFKDGPCTGEDVDYRAIMEGRAQRLADKLRSHFKQQLTDDPAITFMALEKYSPELVEKLKVLIKEETDMEAELDLVTDF